MIQLVLRGRRLWAATRRAPLASKLVLVGVIVYLACPIDIIPDFIPVLGQLDDILILGLAMGYLARHSPEIVAALTAGNRSAVIKAGTTSSQPGTPDRKKHHV